MNIVSGAGALPTWVMLALEFFLAVNLVGGAALSFSSLYYVYRSCRLGVPVIRLFPSIVIMLAGLHFSLIYAAAIINLPWLNENSALLMRPALAMLLIGIVVKVVSDIMFLETRTLSSASMDSTKAISEVRSALNEVAPDD